MTGSSLPIDFSFVPSSNSLPLSSPIVVVFVGDPLSVDEPVLEFVDGAFRYEKRNELHEGCLMFPFGWVDIKRNGIYLNCYFLQIDFYWLPALLFYHCLQSLQDFQRHDLQIDFHCLVASLLHY